MRTFRPCAIALLSVMIGLSAGCIPALQSNTQQHLHGLDYPHDLNTSSMEQEIAKFEKIADGNFSNQQKADACLRLALMFSHYLNDSPDYTKASTRLAQFEALRPELGKEDEVRHFRSLLKSLIDRNNALQKHNLEIQRLTKTNKELEAEINRLEDIIEKLNQLDMQLEQKRRGTR